MSNRQAVRAAAARSDAPPIDPVRQVADNDVDTSVLDKLIEITRQQRKLEEFRTRAEAKKDKVDAAVYRRVVDDYKKRDAAFDQEARPLKAQARQEFEKLRVLFDALNTREERARYDKQELEFRHDVGEMDGTELAERLQAPEAILEQCREELDGLGRQKARFLEAFDEEELAKPVDDEPNAVTVERPIELPSELADVTMMAPTPAVRPVSVAPPSVSSRSGVDAVRPPVIESDSSDDHTFMLPEGTLVGTGPDGRTEIEYRLSAINYIGRSEENQIRIFTDGVSRRHALVAAQKTGFIIKDQQSQNGTFVNDKKVVTECQLAEGDVIKLGQALLVFKARKKGA